MSLDNDQKPMITVAITSPSGQSSEIQIPAGDAAQNFLPFLQKFQVGNEETKRREALTRRPSYRKIYNELSSGNNASNAVSSANVSSFAPSSQQITLSFVEAAKAQAASAGSSIRGLPANTVFLSSGAGGNALQLPSQTIQLAQSGAGSQSLQAALALSGQTPTILQYAQSADGSTVLIPVSLGAAANQLASQQATQQFVVAAGGGSTHTVSSGSLPPTLLHSGGSVSPGPEDTGKKREMRLLKNREAARECRRKKKEYVKCLENRVAILENQNQQLIEELHKMKTVYSKDTVDQRQAQETSVLTPATLTAVVTSADGLPMLVTSGGEMELSPAHKTD